MSFRKIFEEVLFEQKEMVLHQISKDEKILQLDSNKFQVISKSFKINDTVNTLKDALELYEAPLSVHFENSKNIEKDIENTKKEIMKKSKSY